MGGASVMARAPRRLNTLLTCHTHAAPPNARTRTEVDSSNMLATHPSVAQPANARGVLQHVRTEHFLLFGGSCVAPAQLAHVPAGLSCWRVRSAACAALAKPLKRSRSACHLVSTSLCPAYRPLGPRFQHTGCHHVGPALQKYARGWATQCSGSCCHVSTTSSGHRTAGTSSTLMA